MSKSFFGRFVPFFGNRALLILCAVFFLLPFALRGARLALNNMKNDVTDWLPKTYRETEELAVFRKFFLGDQFVVITWSGCREDDPTYIQLLSKLKRESLEWDDKLTLEERRARSIGDKYAIYATGNYHEDWSAHGERWLKGRDSWFFITRDGSLYKWDGDENIVQAVARSLDRFYNGKNKATGKFITRFQPDSDSGNAPGENNPFYQDPTKFFARFFKSVTSGPEIFNKLAGENGVLRLGKYDEKDQATFDVKVEANQKLTGLLFGPTPPPEFKWTFDSLVQCLERDYPEKVKQLKENRRFDFEQYVDNLVQTKYGGDKQKLLSADHDTRLAHWYDMWDKLQLEAPKRQTCIVAYLNDPALDDLSRVVGRPLLGKPRGRILELASGQCGIDPDNLRLGGPPVDNVAIDEEGSITLLKLVGLSLAIGVGLAYFSFRSVKITCMLFFVGGVAAIGSLSLVWFAGSTLDAILMTMPSLVYVLGLSGSVHIVNYYQDALNEDPERAVDLAVKHGWFPCTLAAFTTALGLMSLYTSYLTPIRKFGIFSAVATMATLVLLFSYLPAALYVWPSQRRRQQLAANEGLGKKLSQLLDSGFDRLGSFVVRRHAWVVSGFMIAMLVVGLGIAKIKTTVHLLKLFDPSAKILRDYRWLEEHLGALVPMEILVRVDADAQRQLIAKNPAGAEHPDAAGAEPGAAAAPKNPQGLDMLERAELSHRIRSELAKVFGPDGADIVGAGTSADMFIPLYVIDSNLPSNYRRSELARSLEERRSDISRNVEYYRVDPSDNSEYWRISLRLAALADIDYGQFVSEIRKVVEPILAAYRQRDRIIREVDAIASQRVAAGSNDKQSGWESMKIMLVGNHDTAKAESFDAKTGHTAIDQIGIFSRTLSELLENRGFEPMVRQKKQPKVAYYWLTPAELAALKQKESTENAPNWLDVVGRFDLVVGVEGFSGVDFRAVKEKSQRFIDLSTDDLGRHESAAQLAKDDPDSTHITAAYTGIVPIVYKAQRSLLESLRQSIVLSFLMITLVMMILLRDWLLR